MSDCGNVQKVFVPTKEKPAIQKPISGVEITDVAAEKIKSFVEQKNQSTSDFGLKIGVRKDGCSGLSYAMDISSISECEKNGDKLFSKNGCTAMVEKSSYLFVIGSQLDYTEALTGSGFQIVNPNTKRSCACGSSFAV